MSTFLNVKKRENPGPIYHVVHSDCLFRNEIMEFYIIFSHFQLLKVIKIGQCIASLTFLKNQGERDRELKSCQR